MKNCSYIFVPFKLCLVSTTQNVVGEATHVCWNNKFNILSFAYIIF